MWCARIDEILDGFLYQSGYDASSDKDLLNKHGIRGIVNGKFQHIIDHKVSVLKHQLFLPITKLPMRLNACTKENMNISKSLWMIVPQRLIL
jgi:hypothetical protein